MIAALALSVVLTADEPFGADKALHFSASFGIAAGAYAGAALLREPTEVRLTAACSVALLAGVAKELFDTQTHGDPSSFDLAWDLVGTVVGTTLVWLVDRFVLRGWRESPAH